MPMAASGDLILCSNEEQETNDNVNRWNPNIKMQQSEILKSPQKIEEDAKYGQLSDNNLPELQSRRRTGGNV